MRPGRKLKVIVTRRLPREIEARMMELFDTRLNEDDRPLDREALALAMAEADVLVPTVTDTIDGDLMGHAGPDLKLIASFGTGVDHIDLAAAKERGILVTNTPGVLTEDTADMTMALILAVPRRLSEGERLLQGRRLAGLGADHHAGPPDLGQAPRHHRHGADRPGGGPQGAGLRPLHPLPQPQSPRRRDRSRARGDVVAKPGPDVGAHGLRLDPLPEHAGDLSPALGAAARPAATASLCHQHIARPCHRRGGPGAPARGRQDRRRRARRLRARAACHAQAAHPRQRGGAAAHRLGHDRGPPRHGREGADQHSDVCRRAQPARSGHRSRGTDQGLGRGGRRRCSSADAWRS